MNVEMEMLVFFIVVFVIAFEKIKRGK